MAFVALEAMVSLYAGSDMVSRSKEWLYSDLYWASPSSRPERLSFPPGTSMDWRRLVRTSVMFLTLLSVGEPVMVRKSAVVLGKRVLHPQEKLWCPREKRGKRGGWRFSTMINNTARRRAL